MYWKEYRKFFSSLCLLFFDRSCAIGIAQTGNRPGSYMTQYRNIPTEGQAPNLCPIIPETLINHAVWWALVCWATKWLFELKINLPVQLESISFSARITFTFAPIWSPSLTSKGAPAASDAEAADRTAASSNTSHKAGYVLYLVAYALRVKPV